MISGAAVVAGIAGRPVAHSLSPVIHNAWIAAAGLDAAYVPFAPADEAGFRTLVAAGRAGLIRGLNITAPFKGEALALADTATDAARRAGSANLLIFEAGRARADSTDGQGLMAALAEQAPKLVVTDRPVAVLGAGGAARAAVAALIAAGAEVGVFNRTRARAEALAADLGARVISAGDLAEVGLVINALSVRPETDVAALRVDAVLMDMTYRPRITPFLAGGRARGLTVVDGLAMLIGQAGPSFRALFGIEPPPLDVRALALRALGDEA